MTRRVVLVVAVVVSFTFAPHPAAGQDDIADQCRTIVGCADPGPKPENPGDRGGYAQLLTLGALVGGIGFIAFRVVRAARAAQPVETG